MGSLKEYKNNVLKVLFVTEIEKESSNKEKDDFNNENRVLQEIENKGAIVACDATAKGNHIAGYWRFTNNYNNKITDGYIYSNIWDKNTPKPAKVLTILCIVKEI